MTSLSIEQYVEILERRIALEAEVLECGEIFASLAADRNALNNAVKSHLSKMVHDGFYSSRLFSNDHFVITEDGAKFSRTGLGKRPFDLMIGLHSSESKVVTSNSLYCLVSPLGTAVAVETFYLPQEWNSSIYQPDVALTRGEDIRLEVGDILKVYPGGPIHRIAPAQPTLLLKLVSKPVDPFEWSFDTQTLLPWQTIATKMEESLLADACNGARVLPDQEMNDALLSVTFHENHFVRWSAFKALAEVEPTRSIERLAALVDDPHPHIADAARKTQMSFLHRWKEN